MAIRRIGQIFVDLGMITDDQLELLLEEQKRRPGELLGKVAESLGYITEEQLAQALAEQMSMRVVNLGELNIEPDVLAKVTEPMAQLYRVIPIEFDDDTLTVAMCDPQKLTIRDELRTLLGYNIKARVATERDVLKALEKFYTTGSESVESLVANLEDDEDLRKAAEGVDDGPLDLTSVEAMADSAPVRKLLNMVLLMAIRDHA
ncbi:MAG TPA: pilus assembly protein PilB, partial [Pirellulales bacterium]|nr:pilus assembly protein PilB [Pirellulales bacterium]